MTGPMGPDALHAVLDAALSAEGADGLEARADRSWGGLTRFARSTIHQHVESDDTRISVRAVVGSRLGTASGNDTSPEGALRVARAAIAAARVAPETPDFPGLAEPAEVPELPGRYDEATAAASPARRADGVASLLKTLRAGQEAAGAISTSGNEVAFATTEGARLHGAYTRAAASTVVMGEGASGHGEDAAAALGAVDPVAVGERAARTCAAAAAPVDAPPGQWDVVLLPSAVTTFLEYLAFIAFSAKAFAEGRSALCGRIGTSVASELVSIADDPLGDGAIGLGFDGEGTPRSRVELVSRGTAMGLVHDRATAAASGTTSTGHGLPAPNPFGPLASHLVMAPGSSSVDELVAGVDRGLLVTRFWYTRTVNPKRTLLTGMTRDGTFLIDGGEVGRPVRNLRYNHAILDALAACDGVGDELRACSDESSDSRAPALRIRSFTFTSASDH